MIKKKIAKYFLMKFPGLWTIAIVVMKFRVFKLILDIIIQLRKYLCQCQCQDTDSKT